MIMSTYATKQDIEKIVGRAIDKAVTDLSEIISTFAQQVDTRFNKVEKELSELRESHHRLLDTIDGFVGRIDRYETEQLMRALGPNGPLVIAAIHDLFTYYGGERLYRIEQPAVG